MAAPETTPESGAAERAAESARAAREHIDRLPHGCWVEIDVSDPHARIAVKPCCGPDRDPSPTCGAYGVYLQPSSTGEDGRPLRAMVRLHDEAQGIASGVPFAALRRTDYRDTTDLRTQGAPT
jgi:hypothetical protein